MIPTHPYIFRSSHRSRLDPKRLCPRTRHRDSGRSFGVVRECELGNTKKQQRARVSEKRRATPKALDETVRVRTRGRSTQRGGGGWRAAMGVRRTATRPSSTAARAARRRAERHHACREVPRHSCGLTVYRAVARLVSSRLPTRGVLPVRPRVRGSGFVVADSVAVSLSLSFGPAQRLRRLHGRAWGVFRASRRLRSASRLSRFPCLGVQWLPSPSAGDELGGAFRELPVPGGPAKRASLHHHQAGARPRARRVPFR